MNPTVVTRGLSCGYLRALSSTGLINQRYRSPAIRGADHAPSPSQGERFGLSGPGWIWVGAIVLALAHYPVARAFAAYKQRQKRAKPWLSYF